MPVASHARSHRQPRNAAILLTVLVVIALLTVGSASFYDWTFTEYRASRAYSRQAQARLAAESGVEAVRALLLSDPEAIRAAGGLYENEGRFRGLILLDDAAAAYRCRVSVIAPALDFGVYAGLRFGLENESSRLNLNTLLALDEVSDTAARDRLMGLPGMTESIADAILDWIDPDSEPRPLGAEESYYGSLVPAYGPRNGPLESIDQLLLVRDVSPELLYGLDRNRDLLVDVDEAAGVPPPGVDSAGGEMDRGWSAYLSLYSSEHELTPEGEPKINVNTDDLVALYEEVSRVLGEDVANFVVAYRQGGPVEEDGAEAPGADATQPLPAQGVRIDFEAPAAVTIDNLMRLVGVEVEVVQRGKDQKERIEALLPEGDAGGRLLELQDYLTVHAGETVPGRLNINQAPRALLATLPGLPPSAVEAIIAARDPDPAKARPERRHASWIYSEGLISLAEIQELAPLITAGGNVYRAQYIGFYDEEGPRRRLEVVIDDTGETPRVVAQFDLSPLGGGPSPADLGAEVPGAAGVAGRAP